MVTTRNKKKSQDVEQAVKPPSMDAGAGSGSDDDAPEEIGLELSKQVAAKRRRDEREAKVVAAHAAKKLRRRQHQLIEQDHEEDGSLEGDEEEKKQEEEGSQEDLDLLPEDVLADIAQTDRRPYEQRLISNQLRQAPSANTQRKQLSDREIGPVTVKILSKVGDTQASENAKEFLQKKIVHGNRRSHEMLLPARIGSHFVYGPARLK